MVAVEEAMATASPRVYGTVMAFYVQAPSAETSVLIRSLWGLNKYQDLRGDILNYGVTTIALRPTVAAGHRWAALNCPVASTRPTLTWACMCEE